MANVVLLAAVELIVLHMIDGRIVQVNPKQVTHLLSEKLDDTNKALPEAVHCIVRFTDGAFLSVSETCDTVRGLMKGMNP